MQNQAEYLGYIPLAQHTTHTTTNQMSANNFQTAQFSPQQFQYSPQTQINRFQQPQTSPIPQNIQYKQVQASPIQRQVISPVKQNIVYQQPQRIYQQPQVVVQQQQVYQQPQSVVKEVHHIERPLEVITIEEIEGPWRLKCATLERQILELQIQLRKGGLPTVETVEVVDDTRLKELEAKKKRLQDLIAQRDNEIDDMNQRIQELQIEIETVTTEKLTYYTTEVETWKKKYAELQRENTDAERDLQDADRELEKLKKQEVVSRSEVKRSSKIY